MPSSSNTKLAQGNAAYHNKDFSGAIRCYVELLTAKPAISKLISANLTLARNRYREEREKDIQLKAAVCGWELSHNAAERVYTLAELYKTFTQVNIIGCYFSSRGRKVWPPIRDKNIPIHSFVVEDEAKFIEQALQLVASHPYDLVHLSNPRMPNVLMGMLYKLVWGVRVLMDIDGKGWDFIDGQTPIRVDEYIAQQGKLPGLADLIGTDWTRLSVGLVKSFDGVTVSNPALQQRFGGDIICHAHNEAHDHLLHVVQQNRNRRLDQQLEKLSRSSGNPILTSLFPVNNAQAGNFFLQAYSVRNLRPATEICAKDIALIQESGLFDEAWYLQTYPQARISQMDPVKHYLWIGARLQHNPSPFFSTSAYLEANPDVDEAGINPLLHYVCHGRREGRHIMPLRAMDPAAWRQGQVSRIDGASSVLLCAHEVSGQLFGAERSFIDVVEALGQMKLNIFITVPKKGNNPDYLKQLGNKSCGLYSFPYLQWSKNHTHSKTSVEDFTHIIKKHNIDLVYCNTIVLVDPLVAGQRSGRLTVVHAREIIRHDQHLCNHIGMDAFNITRCILQQTDYVIANSATTQKNFAHSRRSLQVSNVVDVDSLDIPNPAGNTLTFGIVGSNTPKKGIADFIEVARRVENQVPNARFRVIGPQNGYVAELKAATLPSNLTFAGYANSPAEAMAQVNVVMSLSHFAESFGRTVAEAQAARRPVIAYQWGAIPELIDDGKTGFLVDYKDIDAVVERVKALCKKPKLITTLGEAGRKNSLRQYAPVVLRNSLRHALSMILGGSVALRADETRCLTIIIPVYNAPDAVKSCLQSVLAHTNLDRHRVLVINDDSTDERVQPLLERFAHNQGFHLLVNPQNRGYTHTINRGITWAGDDDILLLNSDTIVHAGWVEGLQKIAFGTPKAGTVTAMGDNAGVFSFPNPNITNPKPEGISHDDWAKRITDSTWASEPIEVPTGNGFCMYIRRDLIDHIGLFDAEAFPRGYGEENDFCMRAIQAGWINLISPHTYIFHQRTASFGSEREGLIKKAMKIINQRYPDYAHQVEEAFGSDQIKELRRLAAQTCDRPN